MKGTFALLVFFTATACSAAERDLQEGDAGTSDPCANAAVEEVCGFCREGFHPEAWLDEPCDGNTMWRCREDCGRFVRCRPPEGCPDGWVAGEALKTEQCGLSDPNTLVCEPAEAPDSGADSPSSTNLTLEPIAVWQQGDPQGTLGAVEHRFCFLTGVGGRFSGGGEAVRVEPSAGSWILHGTSGQTGVHAKARCVTWEAGAPFAVESRRSWSHDSTGPVQIGAADGRFCAFVDVGGVLTNANSAQVGRVSGQWQMDGNATWLVAGAQCLVGPLTVDGPHAWTYGEVTLTIGERTACALTKVSGPLASTDDLSVLHQANTTWVVGGTNGAAAAHCIE